MNFEAVDKLWDSADAINLEMVKDDKLDYATSIHIEHRLGELMSNQLLRSYLGHTAKHELNTKPEHAFGERLHAMAMCYLAAKGEMPVIWNDGVPVSHVKQTMCGIAQAIEKTTVYLWAHEMEKIADEAPLPPHTVSRNVLPFPLMFWSRESEYISRTPDGQKANNWIAVIHHPKGIMLVGDMMNLTGRKPGEATSGRIVLERIPYGKLWPNDFKDDTRDIERILKRSAFLASPYVVTQPHRLPRHYRRNAERLNLLTRDVEDEMHVIALRRLQVKKPPTGETRDVDWKHKWWVSAHYRAQWYPTEQAHKVIWIAPYLKGPEDAPILEKMYAVVR